MATVFRDIFLLQSGTVRLVGNNQVGHHLGSTWKQTRRGITYVPVCDIGDITLHKYGPDYVINTKCFKLNPKQECTLYLEPKARITRDLLRSSGYKITRDPEKADYIIIPPMSPYDIMYYEKDLIAIDPDLNKMYMFNIYGKYANQKPSLILESDIEAIKEKINQEYGDGRSLQFYYKSDFSKFKIFFVPPLESHLDILENRYCNRRHYVLDNNIWFEPLNDISIETLEIWSHIKDTTVLEKCIIGSNWQEYPLTLAVFLNAECNYNIYSSNNRNLRMILDEIQYLNDFPLKDSLVSPKDWNMLQRWIMHRLGMENDDKGFVAYEKLQDLAYPYQRFLRKKIAVSPMIISEGESGTNLAARAQCS